MNRFTFKRGTGHGRLAAAAVLAMGLTLGLSACDELLEVTDPDRVSPGTLNSPEALDILVASAIGEFQVGFSGQRNADAFISSTAVFSDELLGAGTFPTRTRMDRRDWFAVADGNTPDGTYNNLHQARRAALFAQQQLEEITGGRDADWALMRALEGYTYLAFGEFYCGAVPFTELDETGVEIEATQVPLNTSAMFNAAVTRFDEAIAADGTLDMAKIGKARALLDMGQAAAAGTAVASVATDFVYFIEHGGTENRQHNGLYTLFDAGRYTIPNREGINGLPWRELNGGIGDLRNPWILDGSNGDFGFDNATLEYRSLKYRAQETNTVLADGVEARLIQAEAAHAAGDFDAALVILNALRADADNLMNARVDGYGTLDADWGYVYPPALTDLMDPGNDADRLDMIMSERGFWQWGTGHRQGDLRRLVVNYGRAADAVYPTGAYPRQGGGVYGGDVLALIDFDEANNPQFDHSMCATGGF